MERAGIPIQKRSSGAHDFRHLAGTLVHRATGSLKLAQELLGHADIQTTANIYTDVNYEDAQKAAEVLGEALKIPCGTNVVQTPSITEVVQ